MTVKYQKWLILMKIKIVRLYTELNNKYDNKI